MVSYANDYTQAFFFLLLSQGGEDEDTTRATFSSVYLSLWAGVFCWQAELLLPAVVFVPASD